MKRIVAASVLALLPSALAVAEPLHVVVPGGPIAPGERVRLKAEPPPAAAEPERWVVVSGPGNISPDGKFKAPYIVPAAATITVVRVTRGPKESPITATGELRIREGSFPGADSCAGPNQERIPEPGDYV